MKLAIKKIVIVLSCLFLASCTSAINAVYEDGKLTGVTGKGNCNGGIEQGADGYTKAWINNKVELIPKGVVQAAGSLVNE